MTDARYFATPPRDPDGPLKGKRLKRHNEKAYRAKGWIKGKDGVWRPPAPRGLTGPSTRQYSSTASLASVPRDTDKGSAIQEKKAITEAYRRRRREMRQTRLGSKLWT